MKMKKTLLLILLMRGCVAFGQIDSGFGQIGIGDVKPPLVLDISGRIINQDTIPCIMLVCDTSEGKVPNGLVYINFKDSTITPDSSYRHANPDVYWIKGYEVREILPIYSDNMPPSIPVDPSKNYIHKQYLDINKHKLKDNIIVWLSK